MMDIDTLSGVELDNLAAERVMGWHKSESGNLWLDAGGQYMGDVGGFVPSEGHRLDVSANRVLLKALEDGYDVRIKQNTLWGRLPNKDAVRYAADVRFARREPNMIVFDSVVFDMYAPTLPLALVRAICKAVVK